MARIADLEKHVGELDKSNKLYMRQFLMKAIIPVLTEGMIDVWRVGPTDPVDYLAEYIFKKSNELAKWYWLDAQEYINNNSSHF